MSFPPGTEMFQFPGFASPAYVFSWRYPLPGGLPHSDIHGSTPARGSPWLFAACHVLHRLLVPRHPPNALLALEIDPPCTGAIHTQQRIQTHYWIQTTPRTASLELTHTCNPHRHHNGKDRNASERIRHQPLAASIFARKYRLPVRHATDSAPRDAPEPDSPCQRPRRPNPQAERQPRPCLPRHDRICFFTATTSPRRQGSRRVIRR